MDDGHVAWKLHSYCAIIFFACAFAIMTIGTYILLKLYFIKCFLIKKISLLLKCVFIGLLMVIWIVNAILIPFVNQMHPG